MVTVSLAFALFAVSAPNDTLLLDFSAPWCGPCRSMEPTINQLSAGGFPIRKVNIDSERDLAKRFGISTIPCFVLVKNGQELGRIVGPASAGELQRLFAKAESTNEPSEIERIRGQSPEEPLRRIAPNSAGHQRLLGGATSPAPTALLGDNRVAARTMPASNPAPDAGNPFRSASATRQGLTPGTTDFLKYAVRLKIEDKDGSSYGTGTIIDSRGDQALILTCGHIFRDSQGQGAVSIDMFGPGAPKKLPGRIVSFDLKRDVGLVSFRPGVPVVAAKVAAEGYRFQVGDRVVTVGCNNGADATVEESQVIAVDKFVGPPNVQVAGQPVQGRSGGGLFTPDGTVIGVCNAADPTDNAGLFAAAAAVHEELDSARLSSIYRHPTSDGVQPVAAHQPAERLADHSPRAADLRSLAGNPAELRSPDPAERTLVDMRNNSDAEVICIVRPRGNAKAKSEVIVLDRASSGFLEQLESERATQESRRYTSLDISREEEWRRSR